MQLKMNNLDLG